MQSQQVAPRAANRLAVYHNRLLHSHARRSETKEKEFRFTVLVVVNEIQGGISEKYADPGLFLPPYWPVNTGLSPRVSDPQIQAILQVDRSDGDLGAGVLSGGGKSQ